MSNFAVFTRAGGFKHFKPHPLPDIVDDAGVAPNGVVFASDTVGIGFFASTTFETSYIWRTTGGGDTWKSVGVPAAITKIEQGGEGVEFRSAFDQRQLLLQADDN